MGFQAHDAAGYSVSSALVLDLANLFQLSDGCFNQSTPLQEVVV
ncbi:hypothetical protein midi_00346 [Candidatus Midichloria mitochondrii IricVA]|uniref:Uncharacterized protein n=1 Tax=Midichloria mitochondrii (strain IricVA) TaxID=696127 RepID=F7XVF7_MIDMI|nr:hypothetical protein midi_00346 [Candidatus Midichloria mitochondrii IricVA]